MACGGDDGGGDGTTDGSVTGDAVDGVPDTVETGDQGTIAGDDAGGTTTGGSMDAVTGEDDPGTPILPGESPWLDEQLAAREQINDIWGAGDGTFYAVGNHGTMLWYNGATWTPLPHVTDWDLYGVHGLPGGDVFVVGGGGTVLRRDNAGWSVLKPPQFDADQEKPALRGVFAAAADKIYMVGDEGTILRFTGTEFKEEQTKTKSNLHTIFVPEAGTAVAGGSGGTIVKLAGGQWVAQQAAGGGVIITDIWGTSSQFLVAVGTEGTILVSSGTNWSAQTSNDIKANDLYAVWGTSDQEAYAVGDQGTVIGYNGNKWTTVTLDGPIYTTAALRSVYGGTAGEETLAFTAGVDGAMMRFDGTSWRDHRTGPDLAVQSVTAVGDTFVAVGQKGLLMRWLGSRGWSGMHSGVEVDLNGVQAIGSTAVAVGEAGTALSIDWLGKVRPLDTGSSKPLRGIDGNDELTLVAGEAGAILRVEEADGDYSFSVESSGTISRLNDVHVAADGAAWAVGATGTIVIRSSDGAWTTEVAPSASNLHAVGGGQGAVFAVGDNGLILRRDGDAWMKENEAPGEFLYGVWGTATETFAVGWTGLILRRDDTGTWAQEDSDTVNVLEAIDGGPGQIFVVGRKGTVLRRR